MPKSFDAFIRESVLSFHQPSDASEMDDALRSHSERRVEELDLSTVRSEYTDLDSVVPEAKGIAEDDPALAAAIEMAIQDAVHADLGTSYAPGP